MKQNTKLADSRTREKPELFRSQWRKPPLEESSSEHRHFGPMKRKLLQLRETE